MKKFLSLALALIMTMSLVTISTSAADFTDDDAIGYTEAVDVMAALEVIGGYADGSFAPDATLTRGAAAKIICNMILGPTVAGALNADAAPFPDVAANHVFAGYIAYCAKEGIIGGYADGTFRADGTVTGDQFMKMLLGALGYDASIEGFTGANWSVSVVKLANSLGMADGNDDFVGTAAMTREEACLYAFNTLTTTMVEYDNNSSITVGDIVITNSSKATPVAQIGSGYADVYEGGLAADQTVQFAEKHFKNLDANTADTDDFKRPATTWTLKNETIGTYLDEATLTYTAEVELGEIYADLNKGTFEGVDAAADLAKDTYVFYANGSFVNKDGKDIVKNNDDDKIGGNGTLVEVFYNEDDDCVTITAVQTYVAEVTSGYSAKNENVKIAVKNSNGGSGTPTYASILKADDYDGLDAFADEDIVLVTIADGKVQSMEIAEMVSGDVTSYTNTKTVTADGTKYEYSWNCTDKSKEFAIGESADLYLDAYGYVIYSDATEANDNYVYIAAAEGKGSLSSSTATADAYFTDGTFEAISLKSVKIESDDKDLSANGSDISDIENQWYTYTEKDGKYSLTSASDVLEEVTTTKKVTENGKITINYGVDKSSDLISAKGTNATVFVIVDADDDVSVYTGISNVPTVTSEKKGSDTTSAAAVVSNGYAKYVFIKLVANEASGKTTGVDTVMYVYNNSCTTSMDENENIYYTYKVLVDGEETTENFTDKLTGDVIGLYFDFEYDENGYVSSVELVDDETAEDDGVSMVAVNNYVTYSNGVLTAGEEDTMAFYLDDDYTIYFIDEDGKCSTTSATALAADYKEDVELKADIYGVMVDGAYTALFIQEKTV